jgi:hypothetical protein
MQVWYITDITNVATFIVDSAVNTSDLLIGFVFVVLHEVLFSKSEKIASRNSRYGETKRQPCYVTDTEAQYFSFSDVIKY